MVRYVVLTGGRHDGRFFLAFRSVDVLLELMVAA